MGERNVRGYQEIEHTADWAMRVWAPDLAGLLLESARGMTALMEIALQGKRLAVRTIEFFAEDAESLLVTYLSELLFIGESEGLGFSEAHLSIQDNQLKGELIFRQIKSQRKEIKAVTYHKLAIQETKGGLETVIVFDV